MPGAQLRAGEQTVQAPPEPNPHKGSTGAKRRDIPYGLQDPDMTVIIAEIGQDVQAVLLPMQGLVGALDRWRSLTDCWLMALTRGARARTHTHARAHTHARTHARAHTHTHNQGMLALLRRPSSPDAAHRHSCPSSSTSSGPCWAVFLAGTAACACPLLRQCFHGEQPLRADMLPQGPPRGRAPTPLGIDAL